MTSPAPQPPKRLYRNTREAMLAGVLAGIADYFGLDKSLVRVGYVVLTVFTAAFPGVVAYVIMAIIVPAGPPDVEGSPKS